MWILIKRGLLETSLEQEKKGQEAGVDQLGRKPCPPGYGIIELLEPADRDFPVG